MTINIWVPFSLHQLRNARAPALVLLEVLTIDSVLAHSNLNFGCTVRGHSACTVSNVRHFTITMIAILQIFKYFTRTGFLSREDNSHESRHQCVCGLLTLIITKTVTCRCKGAAVFGYFRHAFAHHCQPSPSACNSYYVHLNTATTTSTSSSTTQRMREWYVIGTICMLATHVLAISGCEVLYHGEDGLN